MTKPYIQWINTKEDGMPYPQSGIPLYSVVPVWILAGAYADAYDGYNLSLFFSHYEAYELFKDSGL